MPELPEVETVRRSLEQALPGKSVAEIVVREARLRQTVDEARLVELIRGRTVVRLTRRAKYVLIHFDDDRLMLVHLGMTGSLVLVPGDAPLDRHDHLVFTLSDGSHLRFNDPRRFGMVMPLTTDELPGFAPLARLGVEPLSREMNARYLFERSRGSKKPVKNFIMDQQVLVGVGNIYASEALFLARVNPRRAAGRVSLEKWQELTRMIKQVLRHAIRQGGTTLSDFRDGRGNSGYFQTRLQVYGREGQPCLRCQTPIRRIVQAGRSTFYCPSCQRG